jgi:hypothetical protein
MEKIANRLNEYKRFASKKDKKRWEKSLNILKNKFMMLLTKP